MADSISDKKLTGSAVDLTEHLVDSKMKDNIALVEDDAKREYMATVWNMTKEQIFHELMRVHAEAHAMVQGLMDQIEDMRGPVQ